jgi:steroid delta-isomerase-like uncharacterized protein
VNTTLIVERFIDALQCKDFNALSDILHQDVSVVQPMTFSGDDPTAELRFDGKQAVLSYLQQVLTNMAQTRFVNQKLSVTSNGSTVFFEATGDFVTATNTSYKNVYVLKFELCDGKVIHVTEYANPVTYAQAFEMLLDHQLEPLNIGSLTFNKQVVQKFIQTVWNEKNLNEIEKFWSPDYTNHAMPVDMRQGIENLKLSHQMFLVAFSEVTLDVHEQIAEGNKVATRLTFRGKHIGEFMGIPATTQNITMQGIRIDRIENGKITEHWATFDLAGLMQQISE